MPRPRKSKSAASLLGRAIAERFRSDSAPILQPQSDTRDHKTYVLFVFFVAKQQTDPPSPKATEDRKETNHDKD